MPSTPRTRTRLLIAAGLAVALPLGLVSPAVAAPVDPPGRDAPAGTLRVATYNASLNRSNQGDLVRDLATGGNAQAAAVAEIVQRSRPDVLLLNEFDYDAAGTGLAEFQENYLKVPHHGAAAIDYPYAYLAPSNTGVPSGFDLDNNGSVGGPNDALGFGFFPGQYGMVVLSRYPIDKAGVRTFQNFRWKDMPGALLPDDPATPAPADFYSPAELDALPLSSKSHWDVPVQVAGTTVHVLASHPTPPVFDGPEDRNGKRNHDEIRLWSDYITPGAAGYLYDDKGTKGGLAPGASFVVVGDENADPLDGDSTAGAIQQLLDNPRVNTSVTPSSEGAIEQSALQGGINNSHRSPARFDTADFSEPPGNIRSDYVLPSTDLKITDAQVFWPTTKDPAYPLVGTFPFPSSDHKLVYADLAVPGADPGATPLSLSLVAQTYIQRGLKVKGTPVGGLSAVTYDAQRNAFYTLSDDRSDFAPARFYTSKGIASGGRLTRAATALTEVTFLRRADGSTYPAGTIDPEGLTLTPQRTLIVTSEGDTNKRIDPFVAEFGLDGRFLRNLEVPDAFRPADGRGVRNNLAFESAGLTPDGRTLFSGTENALTQDGPAAAVGVSSPSRLLQYDLASGKITHQFVYPTDPVVEAPVPAGSFATNGLVDILPLSATSLLTMERSFSNGGGNSIRIYQTDLTGATDVNGVPSLAGTTYQPVRKTLVLDVGSLGFAPDNIEGITFGPALPDGRQSIILVADDNFSPTQVTQVVQLAVDRVAPTTPPTPPTPPAASLSVDLSTYARVGRYDLPEPTRTPAPPNSLLAQEASTVTYDKDTDSLFVVGDGGTSVVQVDKTGKLIDSMTLAPGNSPQGTAFYDTEGITYVGGGKFVLLEERDRQANLFTYKAGGVLQRSDVQTVKLGTTIGNIGLEGVTYDPLTGGYIFVKELDPEGIFATQLDFAHGTATNGSPTTVNSTNLFDPALIGTRDLSDVFALSNLPAIDPSQKGDLLVISQESGRVVMVDRSGKVTSRLDLRRDPGNPLTVPEQTQEGVTMGPDGTLYVVSEQGGGDFNHPQLWVYQPSTAANQAPTAVTLSPATASLDAGTSTDVRTKLSDVTVTDDAIGTNDLAVTGPDAASFEVDSTGLYLRAGATLAPGSLNVTVTVDDVTVGATPDASAPFTLTVTSAGAGAAASSSVYLSEVSPGSSSAGAYKADWFELTNAGNAPVDLTGWRMNDDSNTFADGAELTGVPSLPAYGTAIFVEGDATTAAAFTHAWFGGSPPAGLSVGSYSGSGVGLSSGGDAVNVFDAAGNRMAGVAFGRTPAGASFDNTVGVNGTDLPLPVITTGSVAGVNGARVAGAETGSPGVVGGHAVVTETAPWASGNSPYAADWFEVTNSGDLPLSLEGWSMNDDTAEASSSVPLRGVSSLAPGASAVFLEGEADGSTDAALGAAFSTAWFGTATSPIPLGFYGGKGVGLSTGGDAVTLFDGSGALATGVAFGASTTGRTFDNGAGLGGPVGPLPAVTALSARGVGGAFLAADGAETGSPGVTSAAVTISEVTPWGSGDAPYAADWFEVRVTGPVPVDLTGWSMNDDTAAADSAVRLRGVTVLPAGSFTVFLEGTADGSTDQSVRTAFTEAWFGTNAPPAGTQLGAYGGKGVGLGKGGDAVTLFDGSGALVTGVAFGDSTVNRTFDNTAGLGSATAPFPVLTTLSTVGVNGAFLATDGKEIGSPLR